MYQSPFKLASPVFPGSR